IGWQYTNYNGMKKQVSNLASPTNFPTYAHYQKYLADLSRYGLNLMVQTDAPPETLLTLICIMFPAEPGWMSYPAESMIIKADNLSTVGTVTDYDVTNAPPTWLLPIVQIWDLQSFKIMVNVDRDTKYIYDSDLNINTPPFQKQLIGTNILTLSSWYSMGTNRAWITVTADNLTRTYNQCGEQEFPGQLQAIDSHHYRTTTTRGSTMSLQFSSDFSVWKNYRTIGWCDNKGTNDFEINSGTQSLFCRTVSD
ncbi:MAG: hypothetical protein KGJ33_02285, partial [Patescibacteria group bacterium]|nr:hypothetical protein [Patescibacteria group bacterium]